MKWRRRTKRDELHLADAAESPVDIGRQGLHAADARWEAAGDKQHSRRGLHSAHAVSKIKESA
jgi:hypothetical protein